MKQLSHIFSVWLSLLLVGCDKPTTLPAPVANTSTLEKVFDTRGVVRKLPEGGRTLVVRHEEIPGYMPKMTMELNVHDTNELGGLERDDEITFQLVATANTHWIQNIKRIGKAAPSEPPIPVSPQLIKELAPGDLMTDHELLAEDGRTIHFSEFRGKALAFTFIFTRCPLPDYCPRMENNFAGARAALCTNTSAPTNWQFLSISFDPEFDTPEVLRGHARLYRHDNPDRWLFATAPLKVLATLAPELNLMFAKEAGGSISHNLRTVVLDPQGRLYKQFDGNQWTPHELVEALLAATQVK